MIREKMAKKFKDKGEDISLELFDEVTDEVSTAAMKYALLSVSCQTQINFDIAKITDFEDASAVHPVQLDPRGVRRQEIQRQGREGTGAYPSAAGLG